MKHWMGSLAWMAWAVAALGQGTLTDNFDFTTGTGYKLGNEPGPGPVVLGGDAYAGNFLRLLTDGMTNQNNHWTYPLTAASWYDNITAEFDFRGIDAATNQSADGFHFMLVPTAYYPAGDGPNAIGEEPNWTNCFAVGFDFHPADGTTPVNDVSAHWDGFEQVNHRAPTNAIKLDNQQFHHAKIELSRVGNSSLAKVTLTPDVSAAPGTPWVAFEQIMPLMFPYENRVQFGGRTGGRDMGVDIDNLNVSWNLPAAAAIDAVSTNRLLQDFDRLGTTKFTAAQHAGSIVGTYRPGVIPQDSGAARGVYARLVHDGVNTSRNSLSFNQAGPSLASSQVTSFDFRMSSVGNSADGLGLLFLRTATFGVAGAGIDMGGFEEPNLANTLAVGFDLYDRVNDASVHFNATERTNVTVNPAEIDLNDGRWHRADVVTEVAPGGMNVSVTLTPDIDGTPGAPVAAISNLFVAGLNPYEWRVQLGARTGGSYMNVDIDNIRSAPGPANTNLAFTRQDFDNVHTGYEVWKQTNASVFRPEIQAGGPSGQYLRLITAGQINSRNSIALDRTVAGGAGGTGRLTVAEFDFRIVENNNNGNPADGLCLALIPTASHGGSGPGATWAAHYMGVEEPNLAGVLAMGVDLYQKSLGVNDVSVHWNGAQLRNVTLNPTNEVNLSDGVFHHAKMIVKWGEFDSEVSLVVTSNSLVEPGPPVLAVSNLVIGGLAAYDHRVELAARSGGSTCSVDLDNIQVDTVSAESYEGWIAGFHSILPDRRGSVADPDGDGQANLVEYFGAMDPESAQGGLFSNVFFGPSQATFDFRRSRSIPDLTYAYEWSNDLQDWMPPDDDHVFTEQIAGGGTGYDLVRASFTAPPSEPLVFVRIRITKP